MANTIWKSSFFVPCDHCKGAGFKKSDIWDRWWVQHEKNWREEVVKGNTPSTDEWVDCERCDGDQVVPSGEASEMIELIEWVIKRNNKR